MSTTIHAGAVALGEEGVLIRGAPGAGKSAFARALLERWRAAGEFAALVADDRTALAAANGRLLARAPAVLAGLIEIRGLGIVPVPAIEAVRVTIVCDLVAAPERLPEPGETAVLCGISLPRLAFPMCTSEHSATTLRTVLRTGALTSLTRGAQRVPAT